MPWHIRSARSQIHVRADYESCYINARPRYVYSTPYVDIHATVEYDSIYPMGSGGVHVEVHTPYFDRVRTFDTGTDAGTYTIRRLSDAINKRRAELKYEYLAQRRA